MKNIYNKMKNIYNTDKADAIFSAVLFPLGLTLIAYIVTLPQTLAVNEEWKRQEELREKQGQEFVLRNNLYTKLFGINFNGGLADTNENARIDAEEFKDFYRREGYFGPFRCDYALKPEYLPEELVRRWGTCIREGESTSSMFEPPLTEIPIYALECAVRSYEEEGRTVEVDPSYVHGRF